MRFSPKIKISLLLVLIILFLFSFKKAETGTEHNIQGFAWSENIGWISFNSKNCDSDSNGLTDTGNYSQCSVGQPISNYGVNISTSTGIFSGYAWSERIGWISFNESDLTGCPVTPCQAKLDISTTTVSGWAKALTDGTDWEGWIRLRGSNYGVTWDQTTKELGGYAWADKNIGWISFDYTVASLNAQPQASSSCQIIDCRGPGCVCNLTNWITYNGLDVDYRINNNSSDPDNDIKTSTWSILNWQDPYFSCTDNPGTPAVNEGLCSMRIPSISAGNYTVKLRVEDEHGATSTTSHSITVKQDVISDFMCSLNSAGPWKICQGYRVAEDVLVYFKDMSSSSESATITSWSWTFEDGTPPSSTSQNPSTKFKKIDRNSGNVTLQITDSAGRTDTTLYHLLITIPLPEWREVPPL